MSRAARRVLLIEDNPGDARLLRELLKEKGVAYPELTHVASMGEAERHLAACDVDVVLLDMGLPDSHGLEAVRRARAASPHVALVVLTGLDDEEVALEAMQQGAQDYFVKGQIETRGLLPALHYAIERKRLEEALFIEKERAQVTLNCIGDAVISTDVLGNVTFLNLVAEGMTGWSSPEAAGRPMAEVCRMLDATSRESTELPAPSSLRTPDGRPRNSSMPPPSNRNRILVRRDGSEIPIEDSIAPIHDREGDSTGAVVVFRDVSAARAVSLQMAHSAEHDVLTGLPNRALLSDRVNQAIVSAQRHAKHVAILYLDLDGFKQINDSLGHPTGDKLLQSIARRLVASGRASDTVSRQGGDEFVVLLAEMEHVKDAAIAASRILRAVARAHSIDQHDLRITASVGISVYPDDGTDAETLIKNADTAMYQAKENGRQNYQYFTQEMNARAAERQSIEQSLRRALERDEFTLHYQPKIDVKSGAITGAEALIRWTHPLRGTVAPAQFIAVAEDCGLILPIGNWVLRRACEQARLWAEAGLPPVTMSVNVSANEFRNEGFLDGLLEILRETAMDPGLLEIELTESVFMNHSTSAAAILRRLRESGVRVALDDFGTGYSSLSYLRKCPIDALKIDQSFVAQIATDHGGASIVTAVIAMAQSMKMRVVAEGVETREQAAFLHARECDEAQGFYFSQPVLPREFGILLERGISVPLAAYAG